MQAATVAMRFNEMLRYEVRERYSAQEILKGLDRALKGHIPPEMFVTSGIGVLDVSQKSLAFASAGNPEMYHLRRETGEVQTLGVTGVPLGMPLDLGGMDAFGSKETALGSGDVVVFVSDGIEEAQDSTGDFYGQERLMSVIGEHSRESASAEWLRDAIVADVRQFLGDVPQGDDLTVVVLRVG